MNRKVTGRAMSMPAGLAVGAAVSLGITLVLAIAAAKLVDAETVPENGIGYLALGILLLASSAGAWVSWKTIKRQRLVVCMISGGIYYGLLLSMTALFFGGQYTGMGVTALVIAGGCGAVVLAGLGQGSGQKKRRIKTHYC